MNYIFNKFKNFIISLILIISFIFNYSLIAEDASTNEGSISNEEEAYNDTSNEGEISEDVEDPFGESLPSTKNTNQSNSNNLEEDAYSFDQLETLEEVVPDASSIDAYRLLSYIFTGVLIRSTSNRKAIVVAPSGDQYVLSVGDFFSNEDAVIRSINTTKIIVNNNNGEEYIFQIGRKGKKKDDDEDTFDADSPKNKKDKLTSLEEIQDSSSGEIEVLMNTIEEQKKIIVEQINELENQQFIIKELEDGQTIISDNENDQNYIELREKLKNIQDENIQQSLELIDKNSLLENLEDEKNEIINSLNTANSEIEKLLAEVNLLTKQNSENESSLSQDLFNDLEKEKNEISCFALENVRGTVQADILKEDQGQNTCIFSTEFALRMKADVQEYFINHHSRI